MPSLDQKIKRGDNKPKAIVHRVDRMFEERGGHAMSVDTRDDEIHRRDGSRVGTYAVAGLTVIILIAITAFT
jgi:hypothetical protein